MELGQNLSDEEKIMLHRVATILQHMYPDGQKAFPMLINVLPVLQSFMQQVVDEEKELASRVYH